jgi:hypothetical protein
VVRPERGFCFLVTPEEREEMIQCFLEALRRWEKEPDSEINQRREKDRIRKQRSRDVSRDKIDSPYRNGHVTGVVTKKEKEISNGSHLPRTPSYSPFLSQKEEKTNTPKPLFQILPTVLETEEFKDNWDRWKKFRKEKKKPITPTQEEEQLKRLAGWGVVRAIAALKNSIAQGYQGIFEPEFQPPTGKADKKQFVTREMIVEYCKKIKWVGLIDYAWGKLMGGRWRGREINNDDDFKAAMEDVQSIKMKERE